MRVLDGEFKDKAFFLGGGVYKPLGNDGSSHGNADLFFFFSDLPLGTQRTP